MIPLEYRFFVQMGGLIPGGPHEWTIIDYEQRRYFSVTYAPKSPLSNEDEAESQDLCVEKLRQHVDHFDEAVTAIRFAEPNGPITTSSELRDDRTLYVNYHSLLALGLSFPVKTIYLSHLEELDRFMPQVDKVSYKETPATGGHSATTTAVFKYFFIFSDMFRYWSELACWSRLPHDHPHIVPFDSVVLDDVGGGVVGFTSLFIPRGTLMDTAKTRTFRLRWLQQLLEAVDDLNYTYGVMHQDIAARNLLVDGEDNLRLFDFNYSIQIGEHYEREQDDMKGVIFTLYEIITLDEDPRENASSYEGQDAEALLRLETWTKHPGVELDHDVQVFRGVLETWVKERKEKPFYTPCDTWVRWSLLGESPMAQYPEYGPHGEVEKIVKRRGACMTRKALVDMGKPYWKWERPASYRMEDALAKQGLEGAKERQPRVLSLDG